MSLNRVVNDQSNLRASNSGGLNVVSANITLPYSDADALVNFDVDSSGRLTKRKGTRVLAQFNKSSKVYSVRFDVTPRVGFIVTKVDTTMRVFYIYKDKSYATIQADVFSAKSTNYPLSSVLLFDGETPSILLLVEHSAPVQLFGYYESSIAHVGSSYTFENDWSGLYNTGIAFKDGQNIVSSFEPTRVTNLPSGQYDLDVVSLKWGWWAESEVWYGKDFYQALGRAGDAQVDQHTQIPEELRSDLDNDENYPWELFYSDDPADKYTLDSTGTPSLATEYSFSDGTNYNSETSTTPLKPSSLFVTFGRNNFYNRQLILDENINGVNNQITFDDHGYRTGDEVYFELGEDGTAFVGTTPGTTYYVKKLNDNLFELYSDAGLTTIVPITNHPTLTFSDLNVNPTGHTININSHGLVEGDQVYVGSSFGRLLPGLSNSVDYYVKVVDVNNINLYFDRLFRHQVTITFPAKIFLTSSDYHSSTSEIIVGATDLLDGDQIRLYSRTGGILPTGITAGQVYWVKVTSTTNIQLYTNAGLTSLVTFTGGTGHTYAIKHYGNHDLRIKGGSVFLTRIAYDHVGISRHRKLRFNGGRGILSTNLDVLVDDTTYTLDDVNKYTAFTDVLTPTTNPADSLYWIGFQTDVVGLDLVSKVTLVNKEPSCVGTSALSIPFNGANSGGYIPAHGFGRFADYHKCLFPTFGTLIQGRLCLSGFSLYPGLLLFSAVSNSKFVDEFFNYYQITDALSLPDIDPFDLNLVSDNQSSITAITSYQNSLFVFTATTSYRLRGEGAKLTAQGSSLFIVAHQGALNSACVARSENGVVVLSATGVYNITLAIEDSFQSSEMSTQIKTLFKPLSNAYNNNLPWIVYDFFNLKFYVGLPRVKNQVNELLLVFDSRSGAWTEYQSYGGFDTYRGLVYRDNFYGTQIAFTGQIQCASHLTRLDYHLYSDYTKYYDVLPIVEGLPPLVESTLTDGGVTVYEFDVYELPFANYNTYSLSIDGSVVTDFTKLKAPKYTIQLDSDPGPGHTLDLTKEVRICHVNGVRQNIDFTTDTLNQCPTIPEPIVSLSLVQGPLVLDGTWALDGSQLLDGLKN
jgi:hypothetical protein